MGRYFTKGVVMSSKALTGKMQRAVELLYYDQLTDEQIAQELRISRRGLTRWKKQPEFENALGEFATLQRQLANEVLQSTVTKAATTLRDLLDSENENIRLKAALEVLMAGDGMQQIMTRAVAAATKRGRELAG